MTFYVILFLLVYSVLKEQQQNRLLQFPEYATNYNGFLCNMLKFKNIQIIVVFLKQSLVIYKNHLKKIIIFTQNS